MSTTVKVFANEDDALLYWSISEPIPGCRGFAIERKLNGKKPEILPNRVGFETDVDHTPPADGKALTRPSTEWPFQRFSWTDHDANTGDTVSYRVVPIVRDNSGALVRDEGNASDWSRRKTLGKGKSRFRPFFNRGFVMSQFMARFLAREKLTLEQFKKRIRMRDEKTIREFLSGDLRKALLEQLAIAKKKKGHVFAALFELSDDELIDGLVALGERAHVVLANGSVQKGKGEAAADARRRDENEAARKTLRKAKVDVKLRDRFLSPGALGHNKFLIRTDRKGAPLVAWTGSTNWAPTGLCTQVNNGLLVEDETVAKIYLEQWHRLRDAKSDFPTDLVGANSAPKLIGVDTVGKIRSAVWFTRTKKSVDLDALRAEVAKAKHGILFLMFMPGPSGLLKDVLARSAEPDLYVRGVVSTLPNENDESKVEVDLVDGKSRMSMRLNVVQPQGVAHPFGFFAAEVTRTQFLASVGHAIIHSKVVVVDPFSDDPVVVTGSHNFSGAASTKNDENFIIVKGDKELAEAYAVNIMGAYAHYRWRAYLRQARRPFNGLADNDRWQEPMLRANQRDLRFFGV